MKKTKIVLSSLAAILAFNHFSLNSQLFIRAAEEESSVVEPETLELNIVPNGPDSGPADEAPEVEVKEEIILETDEPVYFDVYNRDAIHEQAMLMMEEDLKAKGLTPTSSVSQRMQSTFTVRNVSSTTNKVNNFLAKIVPAAVEDSFTSGILPSITIAQGALESAWGLSGLAVDANNLFGIKASTDWKGKVYEVITSEFSKEVVNEKGEVIQEAFWYKVVAPFREYDTWLDSIRDHGNFFTGTPWRKENYKHVVGEKDYKKAAQALQNAGYATDPQYANLLIRIIESYELYKYDQAPTLFAKYFVENKGWLTNAGNHVVIGTTGQGLKLEDLELTMPDFENVGIQFDAIVNGSGWTGWMGEGSRIGNVSSGRLLEAVKLRLTGANAGRYDILYRVHSEAVGWSGWTKNGKPAGHEGYGKRVEAIEVRIVNAGEVAPKDEHLAYRFYAKPEVLTSSHVQNYGWLDYVREGNVSGTYGQALRLEALALDLVGSPFSGQLEYQSHVEGHGWLSKVQETHISGTQNQSKRMEAIKINLTGQVATIYDVYYRTHIQDYGWTGWAKNGQPSGSEGMAKRMEALQVVLVKKGTPAPGAINNTFYK